jgi:hypothetical protein
MDVRDTYETIISNGTKTVTPNCYNVARPGYTNTSIQYRLAGEINGVQGTYEIFTRLSTSGNIELIMHHCCPN